MSVGWDSGYNSETAGAAQGKRDARDTGIQGGNAHSKMYPSLESCDAPQAEHKGNTRQMGVNGRHGKVREHRGDQRDPGGKQGRGCHNAARFLADSPLHGDRKPPPLQAEACHCSCKCRLQQEHTWTQQLQGHVPAILWHEVSTGQLVSWLCIWKKMCGHETVYHALVRCICSSL